MPARFFNVQWRPAGHDLSRTQMHFRRGTQDGIDQRQGYSGQSMETASEFMADQKSDGDELDTLRRQKKSDSCGSVFAAFGGAPKRNRRQTIRDLLQVWICAQPLGPRCLPV